MEQPFVGGPANRDPAAGDRASIRSMTSTDAAAATTGESQRPAALDDRDGGAQEKGGRVDLNVHGLDACTMCSGTLATALRSPSSACEWCAASGDYASALSSGDYAPALSSGDRASALRSGDHASARSSGDHASALCSSDLTLAPGSGSVTALFDALTGGATRRRGWHTPCRWWRLAGCSHHWGLPGGNWSYLHAWRWPRRVSAGNHPRELRPVPPHACCTTARPSRALGRRWRVSRIRCALPRHLTRVRGLHGTRPPFTWPKRPRAPEPMPTIPGG